MRYLRCGCRVHTVAYRGEYDRVSRSQQQRTPAVHLTDPQVGTSVSIRGGHHTLPLRPLHASEHTRTLTLRRVWFVCCLWMGGPLQVEQVTFQLDMGFTTVQTNVAANPTAVITSPLLHPHMTHRAYAFERRVPWWNRHYCACSF
jgi:hypothetical protein